MGNFIEYKSNNGYTGRLYGESSLSIIETESGKEVFHTGFRNCNSLKDFHKQVDDFPKFLDAISRMCKSKKCSTGNPYVTNFDRKHCKPYHYTSEEDTKDGNN